MLLGARLYVGARLFVAIRLSPPPPRDLVTRVFLTLWQARRVAIAGRQVVSVVPLRCARGAMLQPVGNVSESWGRSTSGQRPVQ
eukprot:6563340-Heterocapsa_arctica.AAC.1